MASSVKISLAKCKQLLHLQTDEDFWTFMKNMDFWTRGTEMEQDKDGNVWFKVIENLEARQKDENLKETTDVGKWLKYAKNMSDII